MSTPSRPDFAQKLLSDLKMRKERMVVATQASGRNSGNIPSSSSDASRGTRRSHRSSTEMRSQAKSTPNTMNTGKMQRASTGSQSSRMKAESSSSMIVPYGGGRGGSKQPVDLSMTLSYALDDNGKLKQMNLTGSNAVIGFLRQISRKRTDFPSADSKIQWPSSAQFPTLTNLRVDEVSKGAKRLNQILNNFYNGGCSVDIGKELLKGTMELEESLRMLVSLQETSEFMVAPQRKSRVKLLEMGEDDDGKEAKKRVEKPVFSFDKRAKNEKAVMAITYPKEASGEGKQQKKPSVFSKKPEGAKISNVVAKLMGLEEAPRNGGEGNKVQRMTFGFGDEDGWDPKTSSKIVILASKKVESEERKPAWSQREREEMMTHMMQLNRQDNGGVKKAPSKSEKRSVSKAPERRVGQEKSVREGRLQQPKAPQRAETQGKSGKRGLSKAPARKTEAVIETLAPKDIHEVKDEKVLKEVAFESPVSIKDVISEKLKQKPQGNESNSTRKVVNKMAKNGPNQKANEVMAKLAKSASKPSRAMKQQATILQGLKQRKPGIANSKQHKEIHRETEDLENIPQTLTMQNQDVNLKLDQLLMQGKVAESKPQTNELVQDSGNQEKAVLARIDTQKPLTDEEMYLKQTLITSQVFLNTAEALFKLDIPIGIILNGGDIICQQDKESKLVIDCAYEMLKMKGKRRELVFYPCKNTRLSEIKITSLDDLVRQLHTDFDSLRSYGKTANSEFDQVEYLLKMMERDIHHKEMDVNCMWDMGWCERVFGYIEMDEVIRDVEKCMLNELLDDVLEGFTKANPSIACV